MWKVDPPIDTAESAAKACVQGTRDSALRGAVIAALPQIGINAATYRSNAAASTLHATNAYNFPVPGVSPAQMKSLYTDGMVGRSNGRRIYDRILSSAPQGRCAYCQYGQAKTLDHFMPKDKHPNLSVEPFNLVPCCHQCNHELLVAWGAEASKEFLHPYFMPDVGRWLYVVVNHTEPVTVSYYANPEESLPQLLRSRTINQFEALSLGSMYSVVATQELTGLGRRLADIGSAKDVQSHLLEVSKIDFAADKNHRRGVLLEALGNDDWYCAGGFRESLPV